MEKMFVKSRISDVKLLDYIKTKSSHKTILYLNLGVKNIRLICYSEQFISHIKKQLAYVVCDNVSDYDATIVLWQENDVENLYENKDLHMQVEAAGAKGITYIVTNENTIILYAPDSETYFYGVKNLDPEEFAKEGHIFVQILNKILKTENTNLVHGACIGLDNIGILFCARGQKGKSTLAVLSMLEGFEYVSDDYLILEKDNNKLFAYPIYSIITLSPRMYNELYDKLEGARFLSNNARKDKYILNIENFHGRFMKKYPIELCMSLEFTSEQEPFICECTQQEKGSAVTQMIHSTVLQMHDMQDVKTVKKIIDMINDYKFYKINLCNDIYKNVNCLRDFIKEYANDKLCIK